LLRIAESGLPDLPGVTAPLVCAVMGREKLLCKTWSIEGRGKRPVAGCQKGTFWQKRILLSETEIVELSKERDK
jgi:hypothetical protein